MNRVDQQYFKRVVAIYRQTQSIRDTAIRMELSRSKVRKILITMHEIDSALTNKALKLLETGKTQEEVAEILCVSNATLSTYLPYSKRICNSQKKSASAIRCENYRARQQIVASHQVVRHETNQREEMEDTSMEQKGYILHLELDLRYGDLNVLRKYGKVKEGITRDFIVPVDMPLHNLHYAIQKAFGWQNSHLHHFLFSKEVFESMTHNIMKEWVQYCGIYFRFPSTDYEDWYWDDDYKEGKSVKSWFKKKYKRPYVYLGRQEKLDFCKRKIKTLPEMIVVGPSFEEHLQGIHYQKRIPVMDATIEQMERTGEFFFKEILERLTIQEVMKQAGKDGLYYEYDYGGGWTIHITKTGNVESCKEISCMDADGLNVMDDVGGVGGYCEFLKGIHDEEQNGPYDNAVDSKIWARSMGWTGRVTKPENIL